MLDDDHLTEHKKKLYVPYNKIKNVRFYCHKLQKWMLNWFSYQSVHPTLAMLRTSLPASRNFAEVDWMLTCNKYHLGNDALKFGKTAFLRPRKATCSSEYCRRPPPHNISLMYNPQSFIHESTTFCPREYLMRKLLSPIFPPLQKLWEWVGES